MFDPTLNGVLAQVDAGKIVLPAMQRPFVWNEDRITRLIDSLLREFPLGTALLWKTSGTQRFRRFQKDIKSDAGITSDFEKGTSTERYLVLDGQQRLTSLYAAIGGTLDDRRLYLNVLSGVKGDKDPGETYWECAFLTQHEVDELNESASASADNEIERQYFMPFRELTGMNAAKAGLRATEKAKELLLSANETQRITETFLRCATVLASKTALQIHLIDEDATESKPLEEVLEIFVRVNSGGLVLQKSDLLMSLLDLKWNDIQPELYRAVKEINEKRPFVIGRDDVLKTLLLANGSETRFDRLVADRERVEKLAADLPNLLPTAINAWKLLTTLLMDDCKITAERFFRGGHNALMPFVIYLMNNSSPSLSQKRILVAGIYFALMSGIFSGAEARMGVFARKRCSKAGQFPLQELCKLIRQHYGVSSLDDLLSRHLDLTLNIAHGGITLDNNPDSLQRDHIFPRSTLALQGLSLDKTNHYANFHFLRAKDNLNKSNIPPHQWFANPGGQPPYSDQDLKSRLLQRDYLLPGNFETMLQARSKEMRDRSLEMFGMTENVFNSLFPAPLTLEELFGTKVDNTSVKG